MTEEEQKEQKELKRVENAMAGFLTALLSDEEYLRQLEAEDIRKKMDERMEEERWD